MIGGYDFDLSQIFGYILLLSFVIYFLRRKFDNVDLFIIIITTLLAFEIAWELPSNIYYLYNSKILVWPIIVKHIFILYPMYLWTYYTWLYGSRRYLLLFVFAVCFEMFFLTNLDCTRFLSNMGIPWIVRYVWVSSFIINISKWKTHSSPVDTDLAKNKGKNY
jgi:hypothetical protein